MQNPNHARAYLPLQKMSDEELNTGNDLHHRMNSWKQPEKTGKTAIDNLIKEKIKSIQIEKWLTIGTPVDISNELEKKELLINFKKSFLMINEVAVFSGIQQIEIFVYFKKYDPPVVEIEVEYILKDWFGVDERDIYNNVELRS